MTMLPKRNPKRIPYTSVFAQHGRNRLFIVRCHRSYFVNSARVQALQKDKEFTYAVLDVPNAHRVPVSKNYYDALAALL